MSRLTRTATNQRGFTFVELLIVTIMIGLLAAIAIPAFLGQREKAEGAQAQSLLRSGATTLETVATDTQSYALITPAALSAEEPNVTWLAAAGARTAANEIAVTGLSARGYTLTTTNGGRDFTLVKDTTAVPTITRTCGPGCTW